VAQLRHLISDVFDNSYIAAMRPTLAVSVAVLLAGAGACLLLRRPAPARPATAHPPQAEEAVVAVAD
jgi:hypothetical protein